MGIDWQVDVHAKLPSTQDYVRDLVEEDIPEGTVVQALSQTSGRGRQGREWVSPVGNLYMSLLLYPECDAAKAGQMSFVTAVAVSAAIDEYIEPGHLKTLKWPNDVLIDGKKCAGILIESVLGKDGVVDALIIGIGVNIVAPPEGSIGVAQVSGGKQVPIHPFRDKVLHELEETYRQWKHQGFAPIRTRWLKQAHGLGDIITARFAKDEAKGIFKGIDDKGALLLDIEGDTKNIAAAEILT
jgi:BirA family biotin operon repressor/biotin-[acetyl-CoA-carboxylase] ligase